MLYLVGGCSRSGKSTLAERMRAGHGVPWFALDALKMGLHKGAGALGVHADDEDLETADRMWPIVKGALEHFLFDGRDYLVEGVNLGPRAVAGFIQQTDDSVRACFLGYPDAEIEAKATEIAQHRGAPNDWLDQTGPDNVRRYLEVSRALSRRLRDDCADLGLPFIDTGTDFNCGLASAERALLS